MSISFVNFRWKCLYKRMHCYCCCCCCCCSKFFAKNILIFYDLVCCLKLNTKLPCLLSCSIAELVEHNTPNNNSKQHEFNWVDTIEICKSSFKRLDVIKIKNRTAHNDKALEEEFQHRCTAQSRRIIKRLTTLEWA